jgi:hypothetical protein
MLKDEECGGTIYKTLAITELHIYGNRETETSKTINVFIVGRVIHVFDM